MQDMQCECLWTVTPLPSSSLRGGETDEQSRADRRDLSGAPWIASPSARNDEGHSDSPVLMQERVALVKKSAGILVYRDAPDGVRVLLVHPGGPFWRRKDLASWSIPKGEIDPDEDPLAAAVR